MVTDQKHFFHDLYASIEKNCSDEQLKTFANLGTDFERFQFVHDLGGAAQFDELRRKSNDKCPNEAVKLKKQGNSAFQAQNYAVALEKYTESQLLTPTTNCNIYLKNMYVECLNNLHYFLAEDVAVILANRSAALYHLKHYDLAIIDLDLAIPNYNKKMVYKLKERKAKCLLAKNEFAQALQYFK